MDEDQVKQIYINPPVVEYSHQNPHPLFGKDSNILNAQGHTEYPKWVNGVIAKDKAHEKRILSEGENALDAPLKSKSLKKEW